MKGIVTALAIIFVIISCGGTFAQKAERKEKQPPTNPIEALPSDGKFYTLKVGKSVPFTPKAARMKFAGFNAPRDYIPTDSATNSQNLATALTSYRITRLNVFTLIGEGKLSNNGFVQLAFTWNPQDAESVQIGFNLDATSAQEVLNKIQDMMRLMNGWSKEIKAGKNLPDKVVKFKPVKIHHLDEFSSRPPSEGTGQLHFTLLRYGKVVAWVIDSQTEKGESLRFLNVEVLSGFNASPSKNPEDLERQLPNLADFLKKSIARLRGM